MKGNTDHTADNTGRMAAHFFREHSGRMVAALARKYGMAQLDNILDAVQDAFEAALKHWRFSGMPDNPSAWLMKVAGNKLLNTMKRDTRMPLSGLKPAEWPEPGGQPEWELALDENAVTDSQLYLLLACCHPSLTDRNRILITLHVLCGFGVPEIANALQMNHEAVKKALLRGKESMRGVGKLFRNPLKTELEGQADTIHTILYLMFNEGYKTTRDEKGINYDLCYEAIRLARMLLQNSRSNPDTCALLALMFLNVARFPARLMESGDWLTLEEQDRTLWDRRLMAEGMYYLNLAASSGQHSRYYLEALIASLHGLAPDFGQTNWNEIRYLYTLLETMEPHAPLIRLNRIIAESYCLDPDAVLPELEAMESLFSKENRFVFAAAKGHLYERAGFPGEAGKAYKEALEYSKNELDEKFIRKKLNGMV